jgi:hypothetical protein
MRGLTLSVVLSALVAVGCGPSLSDPQRLEATGEVVELDGVTPRAGQLVDRYELSFVVAGEGGEVTIERQLAASADGDAIVTDADGLFRIVSEDLALSYEWQRDELECVDSCVTWETVCEQVTEEVCLNTCSELDCWEECTPECWEERFCDEDGCWTEVVCEDVCGEVCEPITYPCDCHTETYEECFDQCVETVEDCDWVTRTYTSPASLEDVITTEARVWLRDGQSAARAFVGEPLEAEQHRTCNRNGECNLENLWIQRDRFPIDVP